MTLQPTRGVLSVASECVPLIKTGGLADVVGALPKALAGLGWNMRVLLPGYRKVWDQVTDTVAVWADDNLFGGPAAVEFTQVSGIDLLLLRAPHLYDRDGGPYNDSFGDFGDNDVRFAALSWVGAQIAQAGTTDGWRPELVHAHDWQAGLVPAYLRFAGSSIPTVLTIHNVAFQGNTDADRLAALRLPADEFTVDSLEYFGQLSTLKAGIAHSDKVTTVSPSYADELLRPEFGFGMEGVLQHRSTDLHGIVNGIDIEVWDPQTDPLIPYQYSARSLARKKKNRSALLEEFDLTDRPGPLAIVVTRLTYQKGVDLLISAAEGFVRLGGSLIVLGSGDQHYEAELQQLAERNIGRIGVRIGYDENLSHRLFAGGDAVLVPSRFEPCGLTQLYGLRYGTVPVVAATGGLRDTIIDASVAGLTSDAATGICFAPIDELGLARALQRLVILYSNKTTWKRVQRRAMSTAVDWQSSAQRYAELYDELSPQPTVPVT